MIGSSRLLARFRDDRRGTIAVAAAFAIPALFVGAGTAIDVSRFYNLKAVAQSAADTAALATVREAALAGMDNQKLSATASKMAQAHLGKNAKGATISAVSDSRQGLVKVDIRLSANSMFGQMLGVTKADLAVTATARLAGGQKVCLLALNSTRPNSLQASKSATVIAPECSYYVNSNNKNALRVRDTAKLTGQVICTSGGYIGTSANFSPMPKLDCPPIPDPLATRPPPPAGGCDYTDRIVATKGLVVLRPGVYCGGLRIGGSATVKLDPGIYVIRGSQLRVTDNASMEGTEVAFYLQDSGAQFVFGKESTINLSAPVSGPLAGILFYEDRNVPAGSRHRITSDNAHTLLGTIYLPRGELYIDADKPVSQKAAYTIIVADQITVESGPAVYLNANYGGTNVPVPTGLGPVPGPARLVN